MNAQPKRHLLFIIHHSAFIILLSACASVQPVVKIGLVAPFEGQYRGVGYDVIYSARLAVRQINEQGGIGGYRVALVALDDSGDPELAARTAESLVLDPAVVAVVGHWLTDTTAVATPIYANAGLAFIPAGQDPFGTADPATLPADFLAAYEAVTPFDETAGPFAGPAYDAFQLLWQALEKAKESGVIDRATVANALSGLE